MSETEVGVFVQRLRGLITEIGEGSGVGRRRIFSGSADPTLTNPPYSKNRMVSVVSSVER